MKQKSILTPLVLALILLSTLTTCQMDINEVEYPPLFVEPFITAQPASISYYPGEYTTSPPLVVETADWSSADGNLTYQWYTFTDLAAYVKAGGTGTPIDGETNATYTPPALTTTPGTRYYYYVELTNESGAVDKQSSTVRSNTAIISFNEVKPSPAIPLLVQQPHDSAARLAATLNPLLVRPVVSALPADTGELLYQWYQVTDVANFKADAVTQQLTGVTKLEGEEAAWYAPDTSKLPIGDHFFFVVVEHTIGRVVNPDGSVIAGTSSYEASVPVKVSILPGLRAATPVIDVQPKSALYLTETVIAPLTIVASSPDSPDGKNLSYQWYENDRLATSVSLDPANFPKKIDGATAASYAPPATGNEFYYVVVTNTNEQAEGAKTAVVTSHAVNVRRATAGSGNGNAQLTLRPDIKYQYIRGYGGMEVAWANFPETFPEDTELMYNPDRLGYNMLRIMLPLFDVNIDKSMAQMISERRKHYYDNVKIVNKYGGYVAAAPWSPPKEWKSNNSINGGGILQPEYYKQYAAYLKAFAQHMYNHGAPIYCISIQNEPNYTAGYDGCEWTPNQMRDFYKQVGRFTEGVRGYGGGRYIPTVLTMNGESANNPNINHAAIDDAEAYGNIDVFARHVYGERRKNLWGSAPDWDARNDARPHVQRRDGKEVWMTEHNINSANATAYPNDSTWNYIWRFMNDVDLVMRLNNENAFVWWASKRFYSMVGDSQFTTVGGAPLARGWGLSHYSKYTIDSTRIGFDLEGTTASASQLINYQRADGSNDPWGYPDYRDNDGNTVVNGSAGDMDNVTARITAYAKFDGATVSELSVVMWTPTTTAGANGINMGTIKINMPAGFLIGSAVGIRSRQQDANTNSYHEDANVSISGDRTAAYIELPASHIVSLKFTR